MSDDIDNFEFEDDDLNFDDASFDVSMDEPKDDRNPIAVARDSVIGDVKRELTDPARITNTVRDSLPAGYSSAVTTADNFASTSRELYNDAVSDVGPAVREMKKQTKRALPRMKNYMPQSWYEKAEAFLTTEDDERRGPTQAEMDETAISSSLASIFEQQNDVERQEKLEDTAKEQIDKKVKERREAENTNVQVNIINRLQQLIDYNNKVDAKVSRQSLELQFRSYYTLRDLLEVTKRTSEDTITHLTDIVKNTGLPDLLKHQTAENALQLLEDSLYGKRIEDLTNAAEPFMAKLKGKAKSRFKDFTERVRGGLETGASMAGDINDASEAAAEAGGGSNIGMSIATGMVSGNIVDRISRWAGGKLREGFDKDPTTNNEQLIRGFADMDGLLARLANTSPDDPVYFGKWKVPKIFHKGILNLADGDTGAVSEQMATTISNIRGKETLAVSYDAQSRKSVVEIIPFYLRKQLSKLDILTGGNGDEWIYNPSKGRMSTLGSAVKDVRREAFDASKEKARVDSIRSTVDRIDKDETLETGEKRKLAMIIDEYAKQGMNFDPAEFASLVGDANPALGNKLNELFSIDAMGKLTDSKSAIRNITRLTNEFKQVRNSYGSDRQAIVGDYARSGSNEILERAGILTDDGTRRGSELKYNEKLQKDYRRQIVRNLFKDDLEDDTDAPDDANVIRTSPVVPPSMSSSPKPTDIPPSERNRINARDLGGRGPEPERLLRSGINPLTAAIREAIANPKLDVRTSADSPVVNPEEEVNERVEEAKSIRSWVFDEVQKKLTTPDVSVASRFNVNARQTRYGLDSQPTSPIVPNSSMDVPDDSVRFTRTPTFDDPAMVEYQRRQEQRAQEEREKDQEDAKGQVNDSKSIVENLQKIIEVNTQGFVDTVEAIMASSPNEEQVRERYFEGLRGRMSARIRGVGSFLGSGFKTGLEVTKIPFKMAKGMFDGIMDVVSGERDLFVEGEGSTPVLTVAQLRRGQYFDSKGKILKSLKNLKEPVYDRKGLELLTLAQIDKGTYFKSAAGKKIKALGNSARDFVRRQFTNMFGNTVGKVLRFTKNRVDDAMGFVKKLGNRHLRKDLYLRGESKLPKLTLAELRAGKYFHPETMEVLTSFSQIAKGVKDKDGNYLLNPLDIPKLVDINGHALKIRGFVASQWRIMTKPIRTVLGAASNLAKRVNNLAMERLKTDVYAYAEGEDGETKLVAKLYYEALKRGEYYHQQEDGSIGFALRNFAEIRGPVVDRHNVTKLSAEDIKQGLFDSSGKRLVLAGTVGYIARAAKNLVVTPMKKMADVAKRFTKWVFGEDELKGKEGLMSKLSGLFGGLRRPKIETMKVTTDIVYINGRNILGGLGDDSKDAIKDKVKSYGDVVKGKASDMIDKGKKAKASVHSRVTAELEAGRKGLRQDPSKFTGPVYPPHMQVGPQPSSAMYDKSDVGILADRAKGSKYGKLLKDKFLKGRDAVRGFNSDKALAKPLRKFAKAFNFDWDHPDAEKNLINLQKQVRMGGTRRQRMLLKAVETYMQKTKANDLVGPKPQGRAAALMGNASNAINSVKDKFNNLRAQRTHTKNFVGPKRGDTDGDGMRDGGWRENAFDKAKGLKERMSQMFQRKQAKNSEEQVSLMQKMLKTLKKTEKNTKDTADEVEGGDGIGGTLAGLLGLGGGAAGAGLLAKAKGLLGMGTTAASATGATAAGGTAAKTAGKGILRTVGGFLGRTLLRGAAMAGAAAAGVGVGTVALVAGAAVGGYYAYKYAARRSDVNPIERFRFISYGLNPDVEDELVAIRYLEDELEGEVTAAGFKDPINEVIYEYAEDFGIQENDSAGLKRFSEWLIGRFLPVFATWSLGAAKMGVDLDDVYDDLERKDYVELADRSFYRKTDKRDPYAVLASPFEGRTLADRSIVLEALGALKDGDSDTKAKKDKKAEVDKVIETGKSPKIGVDDRREDGSLKTHGEKQTELAKNSPTLKGMTNASGTYKPSVKVTAGTPDEVLSNKRTANARKLADEARGKWKKGKSIALRKEASDALSNERKAYLQNAVLAGTSLTLPSHLSKGMAPEEKSRLDAQVKQWKAQRDTTDKPKLPSADIARMQREEAIERRRRQAVKAANRATASRRLSPEEYQTRLSEQSLQVAKNSDNTLYHMYSILEERLPLPEDETKRLEAIAKRQERRTKMDKDKVVTEKRELPKAVVNKPKVEPIDFSKSKQQRI